MSDQQELLRRALDVLPGGVLGSHRSGPGLEFVVREGKSKRPDFSRWGATPLESTRRGALGLGLWTAHRVIAVSGGQIERHFDDQQSALVTVTRFPSGQQN